MLRNLLFILLFQFNPTFPSTCPYVLSVGATTIPPGGSADSREIAADFRYRCFVSPLIAIALNEFLGFHIAREDSATTSLCPTTKLLLCRIIIVSLTQATVQIDTIITRQLEGILMLGAAALCVNLRAFSIDPAFLSYPVPTGLTVSIDVAVDCLRMITDKGPDSNADIVSIDGGFWYVGGTSASAPVVGSIIAMINDARAVLGKKSVGFVNPTFVSDPLLGFIENHSR